jgi:hypothetical protein
MLIPDPDNGLFTIEELDYRNGEKTIQIVQYDGRIIYNEWIGKKSEYKIKSWS